MTALSPFAATVAAHPDRAALIADGGRNFLVLAGNAEHAQTWRQNLAAFPGIALLSVKAVPLDRRHRSKVDYVRLRRLLARQTRSED